MIPMWHFVPFEQQPPIDWKKSGGGEDQEGEAFVADPVVSGFNVWVGKCLFWKPHPDPGEQERLSAL